MAQESPDSFGDSSLGVCEAPDRGIQVEVALDKLLQGINEHPRLAFISSEDLSRAGVHFLMQLLFAARMEAANLIPLDWIEGAEGLLGFYEALEEAESVEQWGVRKILEGFSRLRQRVAVECFDSFELSGVASAMGGDFTISNAHLASVLRHLLKDPLGDPVSFKQLPVEALGYLYERLLGCELAKAPEGELLLLLRAAPRASAPQLKLREAQRLERGELWAVLSHHSGHSEAWVKRCMRRSSNLELPVDLEVDAAGKALLEALKPLLRSPGIARGGSFYLFKGQERRAHGVHYTPPEMSEAIVERTLSLGLSEQADAEEILRCRVVDPALGGGAFALQGLRYLSKRLLNAWTDADGEKHGAIAPETKEAKERWAKGMIVSRCLYGVDRNPISVKVARICLWIESGGGVLPLSQNFKVGDSVLGVGLEELLSSAGEHRTSLERLWRKGTSKGMAKLRRLSDLWLISEASMQNALNELTPPKAPSEIDATGFHWFYEFPEVFREAGGFSAVISNFPFANAIEGETRREGAFKTLAKRLYPRFTEGAYDLCLLFWARSLGVLSPGGVYGWLSPTRLNRNSCCDLCST